MKTEYIIITVVAVAIILWIVSQLRKSPNVVVVEDNNTISERIVEQPIIQQPVYARQPVFTQGIPSGGAPAGGMNGARVGGNIANH